MRGALMAGSDHGDAPQADNSVTEVPASGTSGTASFKAKTFTCPSCGVAVTVRYPGGALTVACPSCRSIIDLTDENFRIIHDYLKTLIDFHPYIELGTRGTLKGKKWECIGALVRMDQASLFRWQEYLLFNPYYGYRWLTLSDGHWNFVTPLKTRLEANRAIEYNGQRYKLYYRGNAVVKFVLGEFYWRVCNDWTVDMADYISPPFMLSSERDGKEVTWSLSEYIEPSTVAAGFKTSRPLPRPSSFAPNQPNPWTADWPAVRYIWLFFVVFLTAMQWMQTSTARNTTVYSSVNQFVANQKANDALTTPVFSLPAAKGNLMLTVSADVNNSWFWFGGELVNDKTGETYPFERSVEYYNGVDGGEAWSEGGTRESVLIQALPQGNYYVNLDWASGGFLDSNQHTYSLIAIRDVPTNANYYWCLFLGSILPILCWWAGLRSETLRWSDSNFSPYRSI
jgi:Domain of unknown function (DUF4178)